MSKPNTTPGWRVTHLLPIAASLLLQAGVVSATEGNNSALDNDEGPSTLNSMDEGYAWVGRSR